MTREEFEECVACGGFIDYDGSGYAVYNSERVDRDRDVMPSNYKSWFTDDITHVVWYNR